MAGLPGLSWVIRVHCRYPDCGREEKRDQQCIFHFQNKTEQEAAEFWSELAQHKKRSEEDPSVEIVDFEGFCYPQGCDFRKEHFRKQASFANAAFRGEAWFVGATFSGDAYFSEATFSGDAVFIDVTFSEGAYFVGATFSGSATFVHGAFTGDAYFGGAKLKGLTSFVDASFSGEVLFGGATFKNAFFEKAVFRGSLDLGARFDGIAVFERVIFQRDTIESGDLEAATKGNIHLPVTSFGGAYVSEGAEVRFIQQREYRSDLGVERNLGIDRVSFLHVDLERFNFQQVEWGRLHGRRAVVEEALMGKPPLRKCHSGAGSANMCSPQG